MSPFIWPFRTKVGTTEAPANYSASQWRRIDQGQDLQGVTGAEEDCLAIASGTVTYAHDPGSNGAHFGDPYPLLHLDQPVDGVPVIYYGHTHPAVAEHTHVKQGDVVSRTSTPGGGGVVYGHWLEIGPWINGPTGNGQWMHDHLLNAPAHQGGFLVALTDQEQETLKENMQQAHDAIGRMEGIVHNLLGAVADIQSRVGNVVQPDVEAIKTKVGA